MAAKWQEDESYAHVDQEFLDAVNAERKKEQLDRATYELFEIIIDRLEKEWFDLVRRQWGITSLSVSRGILQRYMASILNGQSTKTGGLARRWLHLPPEHPEGFVVVVNRLLGRTTHAPSIAWMLLRLESGESSSGC